MELSRNERAKVRAVFNPLLLLDLTSMIQIRELGVYTRDVTFLPAGSCLLKSHLFKLRGPVALLLL